MLAFVIPEVWSKTRARDRQHVMIGKPARSAQIWYPQEHTPPVGGGFIPTLTFNKPARGGRASDPLSGQNGGPGLFETRSGGARDVKRK